MLGHLIIYHLFGGLYHEPRAAGHFAAGSEQEALANVRLASAESLVPELKTPPPARYLALPHAVKIARHAKRAHPCLSLSLLDKIRQFF